MLIAAYPGVSSISEVIALAAHLYGTSAFLNFPADISERLSLPDGHETVFAAVAESHLPQRILTAEAYLPVRPDHHLRKGKYTGRRKIGMNVFPVFFASPPLVLLTAFFRRI